MVANYHGMGSVAGGGGSLIPVESCCVVRGGEEVQSTETALGEVVALDFHVILVLVVHALVVYLRGVTVRGVTTVTFMGRHRQQQDLQAV